MERKDFLFENYEKISNSIIQYEKSIVGCKRKAKHTHFWEDKKKLFEVNQKRLYTAKAFARLKKLLRKKKRQATQIKHKLSALAYFKRCIESKIINLGLLLHTIKTLNAPADFLPLANPSMNDSILCNEARWLTKLVNYLYQPYLQHITFALVFQLIRKLLRMWMSS